MRQTENRQSPQSHFTSCVKATALAMAMFLFAHLSYAQTFPLQVQVSVMPPYSAYLQDYPGAGQQVRVFIINTSRSTYQIRLTGQLTGDNGIDIKTSPNYRPPRPVTIPPGQTLLTRNDLEGLFDLNQIDVTGINKNRLARGLPLPDGTYQLCIRAYNETPTNTAATAFGQALSAEFPLGCSAPIVVRSVEPPILISPLCDASVTATIPQATVFTWTPPVGVSPASVEYTLRVVELPQENIDPNVFIDAITLARSGVEVRNLRTSTFLYGPTQPPLVVGKRYAWRVQAIDRSGKLHFQNDGKSPVCAFTYGGDTAPADKKPVAYVYRSGEIGATCSCKHTVSDKDVNNKPALEAGKATVAGFPITFLKTADAVKEVDGVLTGHGTVPMPIVNYPNFKLRVELINVQCNAAGEVISGYVQAIHNSGTASLFPNASKPSVTPPSLPTISTANADSVSSQIQKLTDQMKGFPGQLLSQAGEVAKSVGMEVPFGIDKTIGPISSNIAITDVIFTPEDAYFNACTMIEMPGLTSQFNGIPLAGYHICIQPDGTCGDKVLYLAKDMAASSLLTLKGGMVSLKALQQNVTHVVFDENGFKTLHISAGITPPGLLRKTSDPATNGQPLELLTKFDIPSSDAKDFKNWMTQVQTDDDFYVTGLSEFVFSLKDKDGNVQPAIYDHDETQNPGVLPAAYDPGKTPDWQGLYLPKLSMTMPFLKSLNNNKDVPFGVENMICDGNGFTGDAIAGDEAHPIIALGTGNLSSWYCSADQIRLSFRENGFQSSSLVGKVVLPICKVDDKAAAIPYTCTLAKNNGNLDVQFVLKPKDQVHTDVFGLADIKLDTSSAVKASYVGGNFSVSALLSGTISLAAGPLKMDLVKFQEMGITSDNGFSLKSLSTASPQKILAGLPFTIDTPKDKPIFSPLGNNQYSLNFVGGLDLSEGVGLKADVTAGLKFSTGLMSGRPDWKYVHTDISDISVQGDIGPISATGTISFKENDSEYGNGFAGNVALNMPFGSFAIKGYFGQKEAIKYWGVAGDYVLPAGVPGIPIVPAVLFFRGFGGGVYSNMKRKADGNFTPSAGKLAFQADVIVGTGDGVLLTAVGSLSVAIAKNSEGTSTVSDIGISAQAYLLSKPNDYKASMAKGEAAIAWDIAHGVFDATCSMTAAYKAGGFGVTIDASKIMFHIDPSHDKWYFSFGEPDGRVGTTVMVAGKPIFTAGSYFMTGNDLHGVSLPPAPYGMDMATLQQLGYTDGQRAKDAFTASVKAFLAFGVGYHLDVPQYNLGPFYVKFDGSLGFDALLSERDGCANVAEGGQLGINGWYAQAQAYAYASISLGLHVDLWIYEGDLDVLSVSAGVLLRGGLPNPVWFRGNGFFRYRALGGRIRGGVNIEFWYNKDLKCEPAYEPPNPFSDEPIIARLGPGGKDKISTLSPFFADFNYPIQSMIEVEGTDPKGQEFRQRFNIDFKAGQRFAFAATNTAGATSKMMQCSADNPTKDRLVWGKNEEGESNYSAMFYRSAALLPNADYTMTLGVQVWQYHVPDKYAPSGMYNPTEGKPEVYQYPRNKQGVQPKPVEQTEKLTFSTGDCINTLTQDGPEPSVSFSYPFEGQRYYMKGGTSVAFVRLTATLCCGNLFNNDPNYKLMARITPYEGGHFEPGTTGLLAPVTFKNTDGGTGGNLYTYTMPNQLRNSSLYRFELVQIPTDGYIAQLEKDAKAKAQKAKNWHLNGGLPQGVGTISGGPLVNGMTMPGSAVGTNTPIPAGIGGSGPSNQSSSNTSPVTFASLQKDIDVKAVNEQKDWMGQQQTGFIMDKSTLKETDMLSFGIKISDQSAGDKVDYKQLYEKVLYSYYFKTSKYNTLNDKVADTRLVPLDQQIEKTQNDNRYVVPVECDENYETYELLETKLPNDQKVPPFLRLRGIPDGAYFVESIYPSLEAVSQLTKPVDIAGPVLSNLIGKTQAVSVPYTNAQSLADMMTSWYYTAGQGPEAPLSKAVIDDMLSPHRPIVIHK